MYSIYSYPVDASCSSHYARDDIKSYIFFWALSSMETIVVSAGWLVFISILTILNQLEIKIRINNNKAITAYSIRTSTTSHCLFWMKMLLALWSNLLFFFFSIFQLNWKSSRSSVRILDFYLYNVRFWNLYITVFQTFDGNSSVYSLLISQSL